MGSITRHNLLAELHKLVQPKVYLEIGVHFGASLQLAAKADLAIGVDPEPLCFATGNQRIFKETSDEFFAHYWEPEKVDLAFIDGKHLAEFALRDFIGVERLAHSGTVVVFDDMLPRNQLEASREQCPGDWTGDVWKVAEVLHELRCWDLDLTFLDTFPTGTLVVRGLDPESDKLSRAYSTVETRLMEDREVPEEILLRTYAKDPQEFLKGFVL